MYMENIYIVRLSETLKDQKEFKMFYRIQFYSGYTLENHQTNVSFFSSNNSIK